MDRIIEQIVDPHSWLDYKQQFATTLICGSARINNQTIGIIANQGVLFSESAIKAKAFIAQCEQRKQPLLFLHNVPGFMVGPQEEKKGVIRYGAALIRAIANTALPKIAIIVGGSYGAGNYAMCGRGLNPNFLWAWPNAQVAVMGQAQASAVLNQLKPQSACETDNTSMAQWQQQSQALYATARLYDDGIIHPDETRHYLTIALQMIAFQTNNEISDVSLHLPRG